MLDKRGKVPSKGLVIVAWLPEIVLAILVVVMVLVTWGSR